MTAESMTRMTAPDGSMAPPLPRRLPVAPRVPPVVLAESGRAESGRRADAGRRAPPPDGLSERRGESPPTAEERSVSLPTAAATFLRVGLGLRERDRPPTSGSEPPATGSHVGQNTVTMADPRCAAALASLAPSGIGSVMGTASEPSSWPPEPPATACSVRNGADTAAPVADMGRPPGRGLAEGGRLESDALRWRDEEAGRAAMESRGPRPSSAHHGQSMC
jgi:hypothetical protein